MSSRQRVLVINGQAETEEVLKAVLGPRGLRIDCVRGQAFAEPQRLQPSPQVVVMDGDHDAAGECARLFHRSYRVVIGSTQLSTDSAQERFLEKPFHYPELIRLVEQLLEDSAA